VETTVKGEVQIKHIS